ncbi:MAG: alpha-amylase family glycosyl hydrolase [Planctomycetota bacterium]
MMQHLLTLSLAASLTLGQATLNEDARASEDGRPAPAAERFGANYRDHLDGWWQDAVFYEIFVRSFGDSSEGPLANDGVGDLAGLIERLDYLNDGDPSTDTDLGVTALWLMPIMQSPSYHGYDTVDYRAIDDEYGTNEDFKRLVRECERRGIRVVIDFVINHSSSDHEWFQAAQDPSSPFRDWYVWQDAHPGWKGAWGQDVWHESQADDGSHYFGLFWHGMPDLNMRHEATTREVFDITRFWMEEMGVAGFRLDAIRHLIEDGQIQENTPETHAWLRRFWAFTKSIDQRCFTVGEVWADSDAVSRYVGDQMDVGFEFDVCYRLIDAVRERRAQPMIDQLALLDEKYPLGMYATFLRNHDQPRTLHELGGDRVGAKLAAAIQLCLPGVPFIYYGEEIGMTADKPDPNLRTPMQWQAPSRHGAGVGFTMAEEPWKAAQPDAETINVAMQLDDPHSMLSHYRRLIQARHAHEALRTGELEVIDTGHESLLAFVRSNDSQRLLCLFNLSDDPVSGYDLGLEGAIGDDVLTGEPLAGDAAKPMPQLAARSAWIIELR